MKYRCVQMSMSAELLPCKSTLEYLILIGRFLYDRFVLGLVAVMAS